MASARTSLLCLSMLVGLTMPAGALEFRPPPAKDGFSYPECYCTNRGIKVELGDYSCLTIGSKQVFAQCQMSLNNPMWRTIQEGCPQASLIENDKPLASQRTDNQKN
ncbi:hypothetical protein E1162_08805 [Rhodobacteraceae bacterium RKSG542]|uniref:hypothetical protein n=1 Tax=Pseudovibrio flavus TaxID=2529854 RepID=UPI0012BC5403|nr:hypothetical protein [Pseudovibrio flavus]MTI17340.1 hypothetical protein [Pseudovibrio flavus]